MDKLNNVMVIEDETDIREIVYLALTEIGQYKIILCNSGQEGLNELANKQPQLILLDVMMPGMDGLMTLKKIRENPRWSKIPVIFMTARVQSHEVEEYEKLGAQGVISKPFDPITLSSEVEKLWTKIQSSNSSIEHQSSKAEEQLSQLFEDYAKKLPSKVEEIERTWQDVQSIGWDAQSWENLYRIVHNLTGSAGTYGFKELNTYLAKLGILLKCCLKEPPSAKDYQAINELVQRIKLAAKLNKQSFQNIKKIR